MGDCIFCKIIEGEIPSIKILETETVYAFLDINPVNKGHTLLIPKRHYKTFDEIPKDIMSDMTEAMKGVAKSVMNGLKADGYNINMNNHPDAGQVVMHAHFHIIPRYEGDGYEHWSGGEYAEGEAEEIKQKLKSELNKQ